MLCSIEIPCGPTAGSCRSCFRRIGRKISWRNTGGENPCTSQDQRKKFDSLKFDLRGLESVIRDLEPRDRLRVRFVGADDKEKQKPTDLEHYSIRDGKLTVCANWINDRFDSLASYCAGIKTALSLPGSVFMTCYASPHGLGFGTKLGLFSEFHSSDRRVETLALFGGAGGPVATNPPAQRQRSPRDDGPLSVVAGSISRRERRRNIPGAGIDARGCIVSTRGDMA